ncbi:MAG: 2,5-diketo-D-gluconate reductase B [Myxococcota bacterium]|jgi:2,5-diketo-D-gluconate reductase B
MHVVRANGAEIPAIGLGTWLSPGEVCGRAVTAALDAGYRHIDTAQLYGNEAWVGAALGESSVGRDDVFLTTKVRWDMNRPDTVAASVEGSLHRLGTHIDLLLIHWPSRDVPVADTLGAMRRFQERGDVTHLGVSNFTREQVLEAAIHAKLVCNQVEYHPYLAQNAVKAACDTHSMALVAYSPLAHGHVLRDPVLAEIGAAHGRSAAQIALAWLIGQPGVAAIPKSTNPGRIAANLDVEIELSADERSRIDALARGLRTCDPPIAPDWDPS